MHKSISSKENICGKIGEVNLENKGGLFYSDCTVNILALCKLSTSLVFHTIFLSGIMDILSILAFSYCASSESAPAFRTSPRTTNY